MSVYHFTSRCCDVTVVCQLLIDGYVMLCYAIAIDSQHCYQSIPDSRQILATCVFGWECSFSMYPPACVHQKIDQ